MLKPLALLLALSLPAQADELAPVLADYWTNNGSLPPEYAWETSVLIREDGQLELKHCKGYEEGAACKLRRAKVEEDALEAIRAAATDSGLLKKPARDTDMPIVGGGLTWGRVNLADGTVELPPQPAEADVERVGKVLQAIAAAIPPRFGRFIDPD